MEQFKTASELDKKMSDSLRALSSLDFRLILSYDMAMVEFEFHDNIAMQISKNAEKTYSALRLTRS